MSDYENENMPLDDGQFEEQQPDLIEQQDLDAAQAEVDAAQQAAEQATGDDRTDWKARAIEAQTRLEMMQQQQQQQAPQPEPQVDEVTQIRQQIQDTRASMPQLDDQNPQTFWERERVKEQLDNLQEQLVDARMRQQERLLMDQQTMGVVQSYKQQYANNPRFQQIESKFDQAVSQLEPHLRGNNVMLDMIRKNLEYDVMARQGNQPKRPPSAPDGAYQPQARASRNQGKVQWRNAEDQAVGEYYISRGIINSPEEFYDPQFNENSPTANNNGVAIYDVPNGKKGWRR